jgi:hypothetical protein
MPRKTRVMMVKLPRTMEALLRNTLLAVHDGDIMWLGSSIVFIFCDRVKARITWYVCMYGVRTWRWPALWTLLRQQRRIPDGWGVVRTA